MQKNSKQQETVDLEAIRRFRENRPALPARAVLRICKEDIICRLAMGFHVDEVAHQLTEEFKLSIPIKPSSLRTWLSREGISAVGVRKGVTAPVHDNQTTISSAEAKPVILAPSKSDITLGNTKKPTHKISLLEKAKAQLAEKRREMLDQTNQH